MHKAISRALWGAFFVGGLTVLGAGAAHAADTSGEDGIASGNQVGILGELPVTISGNAISILGDSESSGGAALPAGGGDSTGNSVTTSGEDATVGGNQVMPDVVAPVVVSGNAISIVGDSTTNAAPSAVTEGRSADVATANTSGEDGIAGGNQVMPDAHLPIVIGGNGISVIGDSAATGSQSGAPAGTTDGATAGTTGEDAIGSGNQVMPNVTAPIAIGGNEISAIRDDSALEDGLFEGGLPEYGIISGPILELPLIRNLRMIDTVAQGWLPVDAGVTESLISEPVVTSPLVQGPLLGNADLDLSPVTADAVVGRSAASAGSGPTPLLATAALSQAVMLAATGVEALPLLGGIAIMLATGLGLVGLKRTTHAIG